MSERKVLNKYYPIDYDPRRLPRQKGMGNIEDKIMVIRTMAPFHMRCKTCGNYIYRGTKFNSRVETIKGEKYLGTIPIRRFYIRCTKCVATITFKTDPENQDYAMESGATRNFEANRMWQLMEKREIEAVQEEERTNPMIALENRTKKSNQQMIMQENLEELYELAEKIGAGNGEITKDKALTIIQDSIEKDKELLKLSLEEATAHIKAVQDNYRDEAGRMDEEAELEEDDAQVQVREFLQEIDPSELLMLNMEEEEERFGSGYAAAEKQRKMREALDKTASKKKFANLVKAPTSRQKGITFKQYKENLKFAEEKKQAEAARRKHAEEALKTAFADYGSSSSDEETETPENSEADAEVVPLEEKKVEYTFIAPAIPPPRQVDRPAKLANAQRDTSAVEDKKPDTDEKNRKRKRPTEFGTSDFWSSVIKKKT